MHDYCFNCITQQWLHDQENINYIILVLHTSYIVVSFMHNMVNDNTYHWQKLWVFIQLRWCCLCFDSLHSLHTFSNMGDDVFKSFNLLIPCTDFTLYTNIVKLDSPNSLLISILHMNDGLLTLTSQVMYHLISQRLLNM